MTAQAGAVAWLYQYIEDGIAQADLTLIRFLPSWVEAKQAQETPLYALPPAAVPVEALKGLMAEWREDADDMHASAMHAQKRGDMEAMYCNLDAAKDARGYADELTQLIKERSNG